MIETPFVENAKENVDAITATSNPSDKQYSIPLGFRKIENLHIVFWLLKDLSWCIGLKWLAGVMIVPTLLISLVITYRTKHLMSEVCHNLAISIWIIANSMWMISEFLAIDNKVAIAGITYKHLSVFPFSIGLLILAFYYVWWQPKNKQLVDNI